jgi:hypothetical protein
LQTTGGESSVLAGLIDPRFNEDADFPNEWRPVLGVDGGKLQLGNPTTYISAGGYTKITRLHAAQAQGVELVEYHLVYEEPNGWFNGQNPLRSKLYDQALQDVPNYRRQVR